MGISMCNKKGFTLTEVLLAVLIVAIVGVALVSITTAASRESGIANNKVMMRNQLSSFMRQLRRDLQEATGIDFLEQDSYTGTHSTSDWLTLLTIHREGNPVYYCFQFGPVGGGITNAHVGGQIQRLSGPDVTGCPTAGNGNGKDVVLRNVKYIPDEETYKYPAPYIQNAGAGAILIRVVVEIPGAQPAVNDAIEEVFFTSRFSN